MHQKKVTIKLVIKKAQIKNNGEIYNAKPLDDAEVFIPNTWDPTPAEPIKPDNINFNTYEFLSIDDRVLNGQIDERLEIGQLNTKEKEVKNLGKKIFIKFGESEFFDIVLKTQNLEVQSNYKVDNQLFSSELNSTTIINILILERIN